MPGQGVGTVLGKAAELGQNKPLLASLVADLFSVARKAETAAVLKVMPSSNDLRLSFALRIAAAFGLTVSQLHAVRRQADPQAERYLHAVLSTGPLLFEKRSAHLPPQLCQQQQHTDGLVRRAGRCALRPGHPRWTDGGRIDAHELVQARVQAQGEREHTCTGGMRTRTHSASCPLRAAG